MKLLLFKIFACEDSLFSGAWFDMTQEGLEKILKETDEFVRQSERDLMLELNEGYLEDIRNVLTEILNKETKEDEDCFEVLAFYDKELYIEVIDMEPNKLYSINY